MIVNKNQLADVMGVSERTLSEWQEDGLPIKSVGGRGLENQYETAEVIEWLVQRAVAGKSVLTPRDRRDLADAQLSELELARESRKVVSIEEVLPLWEAAVLAARTDLLGLGPRLKAAIDARYGIDVEQEMIDAPVRDALQKLSERPPADEDEDGEIEEAFEDETA
jgi:phage terminase Nu1 subunit (DNA packaging protein)